MKIEVQRLLVAKVAPGGFLDQFWVNFGVHFGLQNSSKSAPKKGPENDAKKSKKSDQRWGPVLLPSVAAQRQHLKPQLKLAFGIRALF